MKIGLSHTSSLVVGKEHLALHLGSGDMEVLGTPAMMALMENAAMRAVINHLPEGCSTVGGQIESSHLKPTAPGKTVTARATLIALEGRKLTFDIEAHDEEGLIGQGTHLRFIVDREKFLSRL